MRALTPTNCPLLGLFFCFGLIALATTIQASNMDTLQSEDSVIPLKTTQPRDLAQSKRDDDDDDDTVQIMLFQSKEDDDPNLDCTEGEPRLSTSCDAIPFGDCCHGDEDDLFDSAWHDQTEGWKTFAAYAGNNRDYCRQLITSTKDGECLAGSSSGMSITGGAVEKEEDMDGSEDGRGPEKRGQEVDNDKKPKRKMHRASLYTFQHRDGTFYHVRIESELGEEYRKLATTAEKKAFILANGFPKGNLYEARARGKARRELKRLEEESKGETSKEG